jgi:hypothetical protein
MGAWNVSLELGASRVEVHMMKQETKRISRLKAFVCGWVEGAVSDLPSWEAMSL